jgi:hypothetical protein
MSTSLMAVIAFSFNVLAFLLAFFLVGKPQKQDELAREIPNGYPYWPPWMLLQVGLISRWNPDDLERVGVNRPRPHRWDARMPEATIALLASLGWSTWSGLSLTRWLLNWTFLCAVFFLWRQYRELRRWERWKADYRLAFDRLKMPR